MDTNIRERIKKLLALGTSPNQNEANNAILKARKLMVEYKLTDRDIIRFDQKPIKVDSELFYTTDKEHWMAGLADVIAENNCCVFYLFTPDDTDTHYIIFYGYEEDAQICSSIYAYAVDCVRSNLENIKKMMASQDVAAKTINDACESYGKGFYEGLEDAYTIQETENLEWGLVIAVPEEVKEILKPLHHRPHQDKDQVYHHQFYAQGYEEGRSFTTEDKLVEPDKRRRN
ncbi:DUF2786 domain-containing protein [Eubacteriaceae bacterium ES3]|nr:DUF2786 domain-containing protein [Eubacteriaceae bacterium ES3]